MGSVIAFSLFSKAEEDTRTDAQKKEDEIILLLKRAKLSMMRGQLHGANGFLHQAIKLAHQTNNTQAIIYTYSLMANLAYVQGQLDNAEKLFKVAMSFMLSGGTPQSLVLMSDLATILDMQGRHDEALPLVKQAVELSREAGHPDQHVLLGNMAGILLHNDLFEESVKLYKESLALAQSAGDEEALEQIQEGLKEVANRRKAQKAEEAAKNKTD
ncbi:tetratricopeptide repeat protein 19, mitochondrial isoform X3 [Salvelinus sp. IW2-2015]|nr:tetratricopeptide repeat protein 19, mitochondrial isoform X3 [Salvelinus alpinus]